MSKDKYEISVWEDYVVGAYERDDPIKGTVTIPEHYEEKKLAQLVQIQ